MSNHLYVYFKVPDAHAADGADARILGQHDLDLGIGRRVADHLCRDVEHRVATILTGQAHDHLAALDHLAGLGADLGHHTLGIGMELGEAHLVAREADLRLRCLDLGARGLACLARPLIHGARRETPFLEGALALVLALGLVGLAAGRG